MTNPHKQLGIAWTALLIAALDAQDAAARVATAVTGRWLRRSRRCHVDFALGPMPHLAGTPVWYAAPDPVAVRVRARIDELRAPARLWMIACVALAALAGMGVTRLLQRGRGGVMACVLLAAVVVAEGWIRPLPLHDRRGPDRRASRGQGRS